MTYAPLVLMVLAGLLIVDVLVELIRAGLQREEDRHEEASARARVRELRRHD